MWFAYAFSGAFFKSLSGYFRKVATGVPSPVLTWITCAVLLVTLLPFVIIFKLPVFDLILHEPLLVTGLALTSLLGLVINIVALTKDELSFVAPLNGFIPVLGLVAAFIFLRELPSYVGIVCVFAVFMGTYIMALDSRKLHWYDPLKHLVTSRAAQLSFVVAILYALNVVLTKTALDKGFDPVTISYASDIVGITMFSYIFFTKQRRQILGCLRENPLAVLGSAYASLFGILLHTYAVSLTFASYALAVRRFDAVFSVLLGWRFLKETNIRNKLIGAIIITIGSALLLFSS